MIPLEKQCVSLDLGKRLKELGVKQESLFYWEVVKSTGKAFLIQEELTRTGCAHCGGSYMINLPRSTVVLYAAFTVAELGEFVKKISRSVADKLPDEFILTDDTSDLVFSADFWAKLLIYLVENKLVTL